MDILSSILLACGIIGAISAVAIAVALRPNKKGLKISLLCVAVCVIMTIVGIIIMPKYPSYGSSDSEECSICGREVFVGKLCEDCFNDWADGYAEEDRKNDTKKYGY